MANKAAAATTTTVMMMMMMICGVDTEKKTASY